MSASDIPISDLTGVTSPKSPKDGGPAFPMQMPLDRNGNPQGESVMGMTLRDYFAAAAVTGLLSNEQNAGAVVINQGAPQTLAEAAFVVADAMLVERAKAS